MSKLTPLQVTYKILESVYFPLVGNYLNKHISVEDFDKLYNDAFYEYGDGIGGSPDDITESITTVHLDIDEYWPDFDPDNPEDVEYLESHKHYVITEQQLYERCLVSYETMKKMLAKYANQV
jgi:Bacterial self-protective colicin-like immunity